MNNNKKSQKEQKMLAAAEKVFGELGFDNAKMEDIAAAAKITKVTLYSYFQSKENLYLGVTYFGLQRLNDAIYESIDKHKHETGLVSIIEIIKTFMDHCEGNFTNSETLLNYFSLIKKSNNGLDKSMLTDATIDSIYFMKLKDIQNIAFKLAAREIKRGQEDGSIRSDIDPMLYTLAGWSTVLGYIKVLSAAGTDSAPMFKVSLKSLRKVCLDMFHTALTKNL